MAKLTGFRTVGLSTPREGDKLPILTGDLILKVGDNTLVVGPNGTGKSSIELLYHEIFCMRPNTGHGSIGGYLRDGGVIWAVGMWKREDPEVSKERSAFFAGYAASRSRDDGNVRVYRFTLEDEGRGLGLGMLPLSLGNGPRQLRRAVQLKEGMSSLRSLGARFAESWAEWCDDLRAHGLSPDLGRLNSVVFSDEHHDFMSQFKSEVRGKSGVYGYVADTYERLGGTWHGDDYVAAAVELVGENRSYERQQGYSEALRGTADGLGSLVDSAEARADSLDAVETAVAEAHALIGQVSAQTELSDRSSKSVSASLRDARSREERLVLERDSAAVNSAASAEESSARELQEARASSDAAESDLRFRKRLVSAYDVRRAGAVLDAAQAEVAETSARLSALESRGRHADDVERSGRACWILASAEEESAREGHERARAAADAADKRHEGARVGLSKATARVSDASAAQGSATSDASHASAALESLLSEARGLAGDRADVPSPTLSGTLSEDGLDRFEKVCGKLEKRAEKLLSKAGASLEGARAETACAVRKSAEARTSVGAAKSELEQAKSLEEEGMRRREAALSGAPDWFAKFEQDPESCMAEIDGAVESTRRGISELKETISQEGRRIEALESGCSLVPDDLASALERAGVEYDTILVDDLDDSSRRALVDADPLSPYAIVFRTSVDLSRFKSSRPRLAEPVYCLVQDELGPLMGASAPLDDGRRWVFGYDEGSVVSADARRSEAERLKRARVDQGEELARRDDLLDGLESSRSALVSYSAWCDGDPSWPDRLSESTSAAEERLREREFALERALDDEAAANGAAEFARKGVDEAREALAEASRLAGLCPGLSEANARLSDAQKAVAEADLVLASAKKDLERAAAELEEAQTSAALSRSEERASADRLDAAHDAASAFERFSSSNAPCDDVVGLGAEAARAMFEEASRLDDEDRKSRARKREQLASQLEAVRVRARGAAEELAKAEQDNGLTLEEAVAVKVPDASRDKLASDALAAQERADSLARRKVEAEASHKLAAGSLDDARDAFSGAHPGLEPLAADEVPDVDHEKLISGARAEERRLEDVLLQLNAERSEKWKVGSDLRTWLENRYDESLVPASEADDDVPAAELQSRMEEVTEAIRAADVAAGSSARGVWEACDKVGLLVDSVNGGVPIAAQVSSDLRRIVADFRNVSTSERARRLCETARKKYLPSLLKIAADIDDMLASYESNVKLLAKNLAQGCDAADKSFAGIQLGANVMYPDAHGELRETQMLEFRARGRQAFKTHIRASERQARSDRLDAWVAGEISRIANDDSVKDVRAAVASAFALRNVMKHYIDAEQVEVRIASIHGDGRPILKNADEILASDSSESGGQGAASVFVLILSLSRFFQTMLPTGEADVWCTLMLDNSFSSMTSFTRRMTDIANAYHVQLVCFTGIEDPNVIACFDTNVQLLSQRYERGHVIGAVNPGESAEDVEAELLMTSTSSVERPEEGELAGQSSIFDALGD